MNEKVKQTLQKGKEIATPVCIKAKALALQGYAKGNELMDKVSFLQKPLHKKIVWVTIGLVFLWIVFPSGNNTGSPGKSRGLVFTESDFKKESSSDKMFYVKDGKDDGYKKVVPNLKRLPKSLSIENLCGSFNPELEPSRRQKGVAYLNQEDGGAYNCVVVHVGNGYVIAKPNSISMYGNFRGYIETDDEYVEGQTLKTGFYAFTGQRTVPLANGSSRTMYSFARLDAESNKLAIDAVIWNVEATLAAEKENDRRDTAKRERTKKERNDAVDKALAKEAKRFKVRPIEDQLHLPPDLKSKHPKFVVENNTINWGGEAQMKIEYVQEFIRTGNWRELVNRASYYNDKGTPEQEAKSVMDSYLCGRRMVQCSEEVARSHAFISVVPGFKEAERIKVEFDHGGLWHFPVRICEEVYVVDNSDDILALLNTPLVFVEGFNEKYGK